MARPKGASHLSDDVVWTIVSSLDLSDAELALAIGATVSAVHHRRWLLRTRGWNCTIAHMPCVHYGEVVTVGGGIRPNAPYHATCRQTGRKQVRRRVEQRRWARASEQRKEHLPDRVHAYVQDGQDESVSHATARGARWTPDEDAMLIDQRHVPTRLLASNLGRTY